jgi:hypothetical protein
VIGTGYEWLAVRVAGLKPSTAYKTRVVVKRVGANGPTAAASPARLLVTPARR